MASQPEFFHLHDPLSNSAFRGDASTDGYALMCRASRALEIPARPIVVNHDSGRYLRDFIWISLEPIVHDRVVTLLAGAGCTGWSTYPVQVFDRQQQFVPGYHGLVITGRCGSMYLDRDHSEVVYREFPAAWAPSYKGLYIPIDQWDGSDAF